MAAQVQDVELTLQLGQDDDKLHDAAKDVLQRLLPEWSEFDKSDIKVRGQVHMRTLALKVPVQQLVLQQARHCTGCQLLQQARQSEEYCLYAILFPDPSV